MANVLICFDGTNNEFGPNNTNVVRLVEATDRRAQRVYYDPGVGTLPEPGVLTRCKQKLVRAMSLAFGYGLDRNVEEAYSYLMEHWQPGDQVFLFGFSRGAYTARVLAGMLHVLGLLPPGHQQLVPYALRLYRGSSRQGPDSGEGSYWHLSNAFRKAFARDLPDVPSRRFPVHFLGLWDTVSSVGWVWEPATYRYTAHNPSVAVVRHAIAIDERRWFFRQNQFGHTEGQDLKEYWFAGVHADVGGGYPENEGGLWRPAFEWIVEEARRCGALFDDERLQHVLGRTAPPTKAWLERAHESLTCRWWPAEFFPKRATWGAAASRLRFGLGRRRFIPEGALFHRSTLSRIREMDYGPRTWSKFRQIVKDLPEVPDALPFSAADSGVTDPAA